MPFQQKTILLTITPKQCFSGLFLKMSPSIFSFFSFAFSNMKNTKTKMHFLFENHFWHPQNLQNKNICTPTLDLWFSKNQNTIKLGKTNKTVWGQFLTQQKGQFFDSWTPKFGANFCLYNMHTYIYIYISLSLSLSLSFSLSLSLSLSLLPLSVFFCVLSLPDRVFQNLCLAQTTCLQSNVFMKATGITRKTTTIRTATHNGVECWFSGIMETTGKPKTH